jgi:DNA-binding GntR family transcriptional regulator
MMSVFRSEVSPVTDDWERSNVSSVLGTSSLTETLSEALRKQIINGDVPPGLRLTEAWVAERFGVARPTAKAGLDRLIAEGLLRRGPRRSSVVPSLSSLDIEDIYFSRDPIESTAVRTLAGRSAVPAQAEKALLMMRVAAENGAHVEHTEADVEFHRALVAATASDRLQRMHQTVMGEAELCIAQVRLNSLVDLKELTSRHAAILDALRDGDPEAAVTALRADLDGCRIMLLQHAAQKVAI